MFIKILQEQSHVDDLLDGRLYCNRIAMFRGIEGEDESGRNDPYEGTLLIDLLGEGSSFSIWRQDDPGNRIDITAADLAEPIQLHSNYLNNLNAYCLHAVHTGNLDWHDLSDNHIEQLKGQLRIDERCLTLGQYAVVIRNIPEFLARVQSAVISANYRKMWHWLVKYDGPVALGTDAHDIISVFRKHPRFSYQREYRLVFDTRSIGKSARILEIGDIRDIAHPLFSADLNGPELLGGSVEVHVSEK